MSKKKKKEKVVYYDDNSTIADMTNVHRKWEQPKSGPKPKSTFKEQWKTYWAAVKMMLGPMIIVLGILAIIYVVLMLITGGWF